MTSSCQTGYDCDCGARHSFRAWTYAHWEERLVHECGGCGRANVVLRGEVVGRPANGVSAVNTRLDVWAEAQRRAGRLT